LSTNSSSSSAVTIPWLRRRTLPSITFVFVVLQLRFIIVHKKPSGNLSSTDALILLTAAGSLA
jgi:hypothetical protein